MSPTPAYEVTVIDVDARALAACLGSTDRDHLGETIMRLLDIVWPFIRENGITPGHNVVLYRGGLADIAVGVEALTPLPPSDRVQSIETPAGRVATVAHWGSYDQLRGAYAALEECASTSGNTLSNTFWEVYGDWAEDQANLRTDVFCLLA